MRKETFVRNRKNLMSKVEDGSLVILFAGQAKYKSADEKFPFTPSKNFYYLTGTNEEQQILLMSKIGENITETLYIHRPNPEKEKWTGRTIRDNEAKEVSGINEIRFIDEFFEGLNYNLNCGQFKNVYLDLERRGYDDETRYPLVFSKEITSRYPQIAIKNIYNEICDLRQIKSADEIEEMKKAIEITTKGVELLMKECKPGMKEYELEAYFDFYLKQQGVKDFAFKTIAASGENATVLHYVDNNCEIKDGDLILFDLGAQYNYYSADISRTFPANGKFTERQKALYEVVLKANEEVISMIKPGISMRELNEKTNEIIGEGCVKLGLLEDKKDFRKYYYHSVGHGLGLDTHDVGRSWDELKEGMVITIEPGLYIAEENIGIRIEDDVLVTADGYEVLTKECIKSVADIEAFMANK